VAFAKSSTDSPDTAASIAVGGRGSLGVPAASGTPSSSDKALSIADEQLLCDSSSMDWSSALPAAEPRAANCCCRCARDATLLRSPVALLPPPASASASASAAAHHGGSMASNAPSAVSSTSTSHCSTIESSTSSSMLCSSSLPAAAPRDACPDSTLLPGWSVLTGDARPGETKLPRGEAEREDEDPAQEDAARARSVGAPCNSRSTRASTSGVSSAGGKAALPGGECTTGLLWRVSASRGEGERPVLLLPPPLLRASGDAPPHRRRRIISLHRSVSEGKSAFSGEADGGAPSELELADERLRRAIAGAFPSAAMPAASSQNFASAVCFALPHGMQRKGN
jgi:hypothetical protein